MGIAPFVDFGVSRGQVILTVPSIGSGLGIDSLALTFLVKCMALFAYLLTAPVEPLVCQGI